jgi:hypothetical protein
MQRSAAIPTLTDVRIRSVVEAWDEGPVDLVFGGRGCVSGGDEALGSRWEVVVRRIVVFCKRRGGWFLISGSVG